MYVRREGGGSREGGLSGWVGTWTGLQCCTSEQAIHTQRNARLRLSELDALVKGTDASVLGYLYSCKGEWPEYAVMLMRYSQSKVVARVVVLVVAGARG